MRRDRTWRTSNSPTRRAGVFTWQTVGQGAATSMVTAVAAELARTGGHDLDDCREAYNVGDDATLVEHPQGVKRWALDPKRTVRIRVLSEELNGHPGH